MGAFCKVPFVLFNLGVAKVANIILDKRMKCIADCVFENAILADIGTDHGKLPIYLAKLGKIKKAVASDINEMPLQRAVGNIKKYDLEDVIDTYLTDGLNGIEKFSPDCVVIAGMGGELIEQILSEATLDKYKVKFILQPMTKEEHLRRYLCENGFKITDEFIVKEGKLYQIICCEYFGCRYEMSDCEYMLGKINIEKSEELFAELLDKVIKRIKTKIEGKCRAKIEVSSEQHILDQLLDIREKGYGKSK